MTNWLVVLTRNNLRLTQTAIASFRAQDVEGGVSILVVDNGSTDSTVPWLGTQRDLFTIMNKPQKGVAAAWNQALKWIYSPRGGNASYALVCNNDAVLRPDSYRWLLADGGGFVTCVGSDDPEKIKPIMPPDPSKKRPHPDFSCFLIRRAVYEKVGPFDERFEGAFGEDASYHVRMHRAGIRAEALELPFYHYGSATVKLADPREKQRICNRADKNRALFRQMYGADIGSPEYYALFGHPSPEGQNAPANDTPYRATTNS